MIIIDQIEFLKIFGIGLIFGCTIMYFYRKKPIKVMQIDRILKLKELDANNKPKERR